MNKFSVLMSLDEKDVDAMVFSNKMIDRFKILKYATYYYNTFCSENEYSHAFKTNDDTVSLYYGGTNIISIYFKEPNKNCFYVWIDCAKQKIIFFNNPSTKTTIYFMDDELSIDGEWFTYSELSEYSFQLSTVNNVMSFLLKNV